MALLRPAAGPVVVALQDTAVFLPPTGGRRRTSAMRRRADAAGRHADGRMVERPRRGAAAAARLRGGVAERAPLGPDDRFGLGRLGPGGLLPPVDRGAGLHGRGGSRRGQAPGTGALPAASEWLPEGTGGGDGAGRR